ncbi:MAG TPA: universal stress protein [Anaerolineae bacterium]|nr:universal stress protein [Anaerolineae bacterium]HOQ99333.1 universal stress protein [Anaerolineae bacterium]HPL30422.1 universal stress protein [Anaerolineae bacterium]
MKALCERLLVPIDASETALATAHRAIQIAGQYNSQLVFVFVVDESVRDLMARIARRPAGDVQRELEDTARHTLGHLARLAARAGVAAETALRVGTMHAEVVAEAEARGTTLVVVGRPLEHELRGLYESRVLRQIIEDACCPVLVLKPESTA